MRAQRNHVALALGAGLAVVALGAAIRVASSERRPPHAPPSREVAAHEEETPAPSPVETPTTPPAPATPAPRHASAPASADQAAALRDALTWPDRGARIEAVESAIASGATETLPVLEGVDLARDPETAPTVIHAVAVLGNEAGGRAQADAATTLGSWLRTEQGRDGADARGNVSVLVDALGDLGGGDAAQALASALDSNTLPIHVQTLAVQRLVALGYGDTQPAFARYAARVEAMPPSEGIDDLLRQEALAVAANGFEP